MRLFLVEKEALGVFWAVRKLPGAVQTIESVMLSSLLDGVSM